MATPSMGLTLPTIDGSPGTWDVILNQALTVIDGHTHQIGSGERITPAELSINADLTFAGNAATNLKALAFTAQASYATSKALWVNSANDDLYYRRAGTDYRLTLNGALNVAIAGGIAGDYAAAAASLYYDDAAEAYRFLEAAPAPNDWSRVLCGDLDLYEHASGISNRVRLSSPAALAASYALTFPAAVPGAKSMVQVSSAGVLTFDNTGIAASTFSGLITASAGVTAAANQHVTISGTGRFKHGDFVRTKCPIAGFVTLGTWTYTLGGLQSSGGAAAIGVPFEFDEGEQVTSATFAIFGNGSADVTLSVIHHTAAGVNTVIGTTTVNNPAASWNDTTINITDTTLAAGDTIIVFYEANAAALIIGNTRITYNRP
jgi:hypothetical protein